MKKQSKADSNALQKVAHLEARIRELEEKLAAAESRRENEQRYRLLFDSADILVSVYDRDGICQLMNQRLAALFGGTPGDFIGKSFHDLHPEAAGEYIRRIRQAIDGGSSREYEDEVRFPGGVRWLLSRIHPVPDGQGGFRTAQIISQDISERKQAEEALMQSEQKYRTIFEQSPLGIFRSTFAGRFIEVNPALARILGYDSPETVLREIHDIGEQIYIHSEKRETIVSKQYLTPEVSQYLNRYRRRDGSEFIANLYLKTIHDAQGNPACFEGIVEDITERKQAEEALQESEARYRRLVENMYDIIYRYAFYPQKGFTYVSPSSTRVSGYTPAEHYADPELGFKIVHPEDRHLLDEIMQNEDRMGKQIILRWITKNGDIIWTEQRNIPIYDDKENLVAIEGIARDVTERIQAEQALRESEKQLRHLTATIPGVLYQFRMRANGDYDFPYMSERVRDLFGISPETAVKDASAVMNCVHEADREKVEQHIAASVQTLMPYTLDHRLQRSDGTIKWTRVGSMPSRLDNGDILWNGVAIDITEQKEAEQARRESEERFKTIFERSRDAIFLTAPDTRFAFVNHAACVLTGYSKKELLSMGILDLHAPEDRHAFDVFFQKIMAGSAVMSQADIRRKDGGKVPTEFSNTRVTIGDKLYMHTVARDISERKQAEAEKARLEAEVHQSQKLESIGRLAGGVAHDLNNLLFPIIGYAELLGDEFKPEQSGFEFAGEIKKAGIRARELVRQLLAFSRKQTLEYKPLDLNQGIVNFQKLLRRTIREDIAIQYILYPHLRTVMADIGQIEQVIMNLAVNAADAMPDGGQLNIETWQTEVDGILAAFHPGLKPGPYAILAISDTGCGMDAETRARIFEPFFSTKGGQGTGLGLATVYGIVRQHGGDIGVYSEPGQGSCFKVYLPVCFAPAPTEETKTKAPPDPGGFETLLLAEDDPQVRQLAHTVLVQHRYTVLVAENGEEALEILAAHDGPLDLLLTDVVMPRMNGRELYDRVAERFPEIKVLYMSGYTDDVIAHHGILEAGVKFIQKPFCVGELAARVRAVLDG